MIRSRRSRWLSSGFSAIRASALSNDVSSSPSRSPIADSPSAGVPSREVGAKQPLAASASTTRSRSRSSRAAISRGPRRAAELLAEVGLDRRDPGLGLLDRPRRPDDPAVVAEVAAYLAPDRRDGVAQEVGRALGVEAAGGLDQARGRPPARGRPGRPLASGSDGPRRPRSACSARRPGPGSPGARRRREPPRPGPAGAGWPPGVGGSRSRVRGDRRSPGVTPSQMLPRHSLSGISAVRGRGSRPLTSGLSPVAHPAPHP